MNEDPRPAAAAASRPARTAPAPNSPEAAGAEPTRSGLEHLARRLLVPAVLALAALVALTFFADARELAARLGEFDPWLLAPVLALSLVNYALRWVRWELYLRRLGSRLPVAVSVAILLAGFVLSITPGKAGELGKAWLVRECGGGPALRVVPAVLAERVTDLLGVVLLTALGALALPGGGWIAAAGVAAVAAAVALVAWSAAARRLFALLARLPRLAPRVHHLEALYADLRRLLTAGPLAAGLALATVAWGAEGVGFLLVVRDYAPAAGLLRAVFDYSASTLAGALSMLPGGLLAAEGSLAALLGTQGLDPAAAASATLIIRAATLWFAVGLGLLALPWLLRVVRRRAARP
ncbi:MAG TPA: lysylphosphatidylglycerol synthase transmembrane domain-containing protein [Thermoanaerobaculia bacterium]|nr:lysylphosphatidylglycerol synthase transmembrane domain-containing protein [Thermoanaerobaculia bacterium]